MHHAFLAALQPQRSAVHHSNSAGGADEADEALEELEHVTPPPVPGRWGGVACSSSSSSTPRNSPSTSCASGWWAPSASRILQTETREADWTLFRLFVSQMQRIQVTRRTEPPDPAPKRFPYSVAVRFNMTRTFGTRQRMISRRRGGGVPTPAHQLMHPMEG